MRIHIENLEFLSIIGLLDFERVTPQKVIVNCTIDYTYQKAFINYAEVAQHIEMTLQKEQFELIEEALLHLKTSLKVEFPLIKTLFLKISKPTILPNCVVCLSEITEY